MVAIKLVPVESDLHEIIKEISIMQQCDSPYVVRYYGSYFKQCDLWVSDLFVFFNLRRDYDCAFMFIDLHGILRGGKCIGYHEAAQENTVRR